MHIGILCVGKIRESYYRQAIEEFQKRLGAYCRLDIWEVADERIPEGASAMQQAQILEREGRRLLERLPERMPLYALDLEGRTMDSPAFSRLVESQAMEGGAHGLCDRRLPGPVAGGQAAVQGAHMLFGDDLSPWADAPDLAGADIQGF